MATKRRKPIPTSTSDEALFRADHTCCVCRIRGKDVQIHHIDSNPSNNNSSNLAVVCLDCHSKVTGSRGLGKSYSSGEVRKYKRSWEHEVRTFRKIHKPVVKYRKELITQIDFIICDILARKPTDTRITELLNILYELHLWRGTREIDEKIVEGLHHLALMGGLSYPHIAGMVAEKLWEMCFHFVGPEYVPMKQDGEKYVLNCINALETLVEINCEFGHYRKATDMIAEHAEYFFEIGLWYSRKRIVNAVLRAYEKAIGACYSEGKIEFNYGRTVLRRSTRRMRKMLEEEQNMWLRQNKRIDYLLMI